VESASSIRLRTPRRISGFTSSGFAWNSPYMLGPALPVAGWPILPRHPVTQTLSVWYRNISLFSISYAFRPHLRYRLTLSGLTFLRKPWTFGEGVSHPLYRYSCRHSPFQSVHLFLRSSFVPIGMLPYRFSCEKPVASVVCLSPVEFSAQIHLTSELLRFL